MDHTNHVFHLQLICHVQEISHEKWCGRPTLEVSLAEDMLIHTNDCEIEKSSPLWYLQQVVYQAIAHSHFVRVVL